MKDLLKKFEKQRTQIVYSTGKMMWKQPKDGQINSLQQAAEPVIEKGLDMNEVLSLHRWSEILFQVRRLVRTNFILMIHAKKAYNVGTMFC
jgi:hypothetical protein